MPKKTYRPEETIAKLSNRRYDYATVGLHASDGNVFPAARRL